MLPLVSYTADWPALSFNGTTAALPIAAENLPGDTLPRALSTLSHTCVFAHSDAFCIFARVLSNEPLTSTSVSDGSSSLRTLPLGDLAGCALDFLLHIEVDEKGREHEGCGVIDRAAVIDRATGRVWRKADEAAWAVRMTLMVG